MLLNKEMKNYIKKFLTLVLLISLIAITQFSAQKANSAGSTDSQMQGYFYCLADPACTVNFNCPYERTCTCLNQSSATTNYAQICGSQPTGTVSGVCKDCGIESNPGSVNGCVSYGKGGEHEGWCGCKITCATPVPTSTPSNSNYCQTQGCLNPPYTGGRYQTSEKLCNPNAGEVLVGNCCCIRSGSSSIPSGYSGGETIIENQDPVPGITP